MATVANSDHASELPDDVTRVLWLADEVRAMGEALLDGDLLEARFLTARVLEAARINRQTPVAEAAFEVLERLTPAHGPLGEGVGRAFAKRYTAVEALHA